MSAGVLRRKTTWFISVEVTAMMVIAFFVSLRLPLQASYLHHDH